jgi:guanylate kinase
MEELSRRLRGRGTDDEMAVERRLEIVVSELRAVHEFHYVVVNHELEAAVAAVCEIVHAERSGETVSVEERFGRQRVVSLLSDRFDFGV